MKYSLISLRFNNVPLKHRYSHFAIEFLIVLMSKFSIPFGLITKKVFVSYPRTFTFLDLVLK